MKQDTIQPCQRGGPGPKCHEAGLAGNTINRLIDRLITEGVGAASSCFAWPHHSAVPVSLGILCSSSLSGSHPHRGRHDQLCSEESDLICQRGRVKQSNNIILCPERALPAQGSIPIKTGKEPIHGFSMVPQVMGCSRNGSSLPACYRHTPPCCSADMVESRERICMYIQYACRSMYAPSLCI